jgi:hypothetical protein
MLLRDGDFPTRVGQGRSVTVTKPRLTPPVVDAALQLHAVVAEVTLSAAECLCHQVVCVGFGERFAPHQEAVVKRPGDSVDDKLWVDIGR